MSWVAFGLAGPSSLAGRVVASAALVMTSLTFLAFRHLVGASHLGSGPKLALVGALALCVGAFAPRPRRRSEADRDPHALHPPGP